eukprot:4128558-Prorocentrum_lima.AAC.1
MEEYDDATAISRVREVTLGIGWGLGAPGGVRGRRTEPALALALYKWGAAPAAPGRGLSSARRLPR